jgi:hypothetical protein
MIESLSRNDFAWVSITMWAIWYTRWKIIHDTEYQSPLSNHLFVENYIRELSIVSFGKEPKTQAAKPNTRDGFLQILGCSVWSWM